MEGRAPQQVYADDGLMFRVQDVPAGVGGSRVKVSFPCRRECGLVAATSSRGEVGFSASAPGFGGSLNLSEEDERRGKSRKVRPGTDLKPAERQD